MTSMKIKNEGHLKTHVELTVWDRVGITLSVLCLAHCLLTPIVILSLPILARYYLVHPYFHWILALVVIPVGVLAFSKGYRHHQKALVWYLGVPGMFLVAILPGLLHGWGTASAEPLWVSIGSILLVTAHWKNQRACPCPEHHHHPS